MLTKHTPHRKRLISLALLSVIGLTAVVLLVAYAKTTAERGSRFQTLSEQYRIGEGTIEAVALSPDNTLLAVGGGQGLSLYQTDTFERVRFIGTDSIVTGVAWSPDGTRLALVLRNRAIVLVSAGTGEKLATFPGDAGDILRFLTWSPDGKQLAAVERLDGSPVFWNVDTGSRLPAPHDIGEPLREIVYDPKSSKIAIASQGSSVDVWDYSTNTKLYSFSTLDRAPIARIAWSSDGTRFAAGTENGIVTVWNGQTGEPDQQVSFDIFSPITSLAFSTDSALLAVANLVGEVQAVNLETRQVIFSFDSSSSVTGLVFLDSQTVVVVASDGSVSAWNIDTKQQTHLISGYSGPIESVSFSPDGKTLAARSRSGEIKLYDVSTSNLVGSFNDRGNGAEGLVWSPDGKYLTSAGTGNQVFIWDVNNAKLLKTLKTEDEPLSSVRSIAWSSNRDLLAVGYANLHVVVWEATSQRILFNDLNSATWTVGLSEFLSTSPAYSLAFAPDNHLLASGGTSLIVWNVQTAEQIKVLNQGVDPNTGVTSLSFAPTGDYLAAASGNAIIIWDILQFKVVETLHVDSNVRDIQWCPNGDNLVGGTSDGSVLLWDTTSSQPTDMILSHNGAVNAVSCSADGRTLSSGSEDGTIVIWSMGEPSQ